MPMMSYMVPISALTITDQSKLYIKITGNKGPEASFHKQYFPFEIIFILDIIDLFLNIIKNNYLIIDGDKILCLRDLFLKAGKSENYGIISRKNMKKLFYTIEMEVIIDQIYSFGINKFRENFLRYYDNNTPQTLVGKEDFKLDF